MAHEQKISNSTLQLLIEHAAAEECSPDELLLRLLNRSERQHLLSATQDMADHEQAAEITRQNHRILQRIFDSSHFLLAYMDASFNFIQVNRRYAESDNKTPEYFTGKNHFDLYPDAENEAIFKRVVESGEPFTIYAKPFVYPANPERGTTYWDWSLIPVRGLDSSVEGLLFTLINVTGRIHAEQKLAERERFLNSVLLTVPNFIFLYDLVENRNVFANTGVTSLLGLAVDELQIMGTDAITQLVHPDDLEMALTGLQSIRQGHNKNDIYHAVCRLKHRNGHWVWVQIQAVPFVQAETGIVHQIIGSVTDITSNKETEEQLRIKDSAIASSITPIALADMQGRLTYVNEAFLKLWKLADESQVLGRSVLEFWVSPSKAQQVVSAIIENDSYFGELKAHLADGTQADVELTASLVRDDAGQPICLMGSFNDVTRQKQAEAVALENERLKARFQKEQERNAFVQRIISTLSHDLRTPLTVILTTKGLLQLYLDKMSDERRLRAFDTIERQVQFVLDLLDDTVNMARGNLGEKEFQPTPVNMSTLCQVSVEEVKAARAAKQRLQFTNPKGIEIVVVDEVLVSRILLNLLSNAIKYSPDDSEIRLELDRREDVLILRVIDHGIGISEEDLPHIFEPFYRAQTVGEINGTGLGLSIVMDCVNRHHGTIRVESQVGQGSAFIVELPVSAVAVSNVS